MRFHVAAFASAFALLWGGAILVVGIANLVWPGYARLFLELVASIYPGYHPGGFGGVIVGTVYALADGFIGGAIFAWLYNWLVGRLSARSV